MGDGFVAEKSQVNGKILKARDYVYFVFIFSMAHNIEC
jgi:hypothetical protein